MADAGANRIVRESTAVMAASAARGRYCATCGREAGPEGGLVERFGEVFCSERHAEEFTQAVQTAKVQAAAGTGAPAACTVVSGASGPASRWKASLGKALCWGVPLLAIVVFLGGGGSVLGRGSGLIPLAAALACPLGMYFMMRAMSNMGSTRHGDDGEGR